MKKMSERLSRTLAPLLLLLALCGCSPVGLTLNPQDLYSLPELPAEYAELDSRIKTILENGAEYAAPAFGTHVQTVQMMDLNGDGKEEAVAFFRNAEDERPLKIYIFTPTGQGYEQLAVIEGSGTGIYSIAYEDLDRDGNTELLVGWRVSSDLQALSVYSLAGPEPLELLRTNYVKYAVADFDRNERDELVVFRADEGGNSVANYYRWNGGGLAVSSTVRLSMTMAELSQQGQVLEGTLSDGTPALFVTGVEAFSSMITDVLINREELVNLVLSDVTGVSKEIYPYCGLYPQDINGDGITEIPRPMGISSWTDGLEQPYQQIDWYCYHANGSAERVLSTYHDMEDGWYFQLKDAWRNQVLITKNTNPGGAAVTFSVLGGAEGPQAFLRISVLTGPDRDIQAVRGKRTVLSRQSNVTFAAELLEGNEHWSDGLTQDEACAAFRLITRAWDDNE